MATTENFYTGDGSTTTFSYSFPFLKESDFYVTLDGVTQASSSYTINTFSNEVVFTTAPGNGVKIRFYRLTNVDEKDVTFFSGSALRAQDLNSNFDQNNFRSQEIENYIWFKEGGTVHSDEAWESTDNRIATTAAMDARFQDEAAETIESSETWVSDDNSIATTASIDARFFNNSDETIQSGETWPNNDATIATTAAIDDAIDYAITNDVLINSTGLTKSTAGGQVTLGIGAGSVDLDRIKASDIYQTGAYSSSWTNINDKVATIGAIAARHDVEVGTSLPTTTQPGKGFLNITPGNQEYRVFDGSGWRLVASGQPYSPNTATIVRYVDATNGSDAADVTGFLPNSPLKSIKRAVDLVNADSSDGTVIKVAAGVYQEKLPISIERNNVSIVGEALRSTFVQPAVGVINATATVNGSQYRIRAVGTTDFTAIGAADNNVGTTFTATGAGSGTGEVEDLDALNNYNVANPTADETATMFLCDSGTLLANMTFVGLKSSGNSNNTVTRDTNGRITTAADRSQTLDPGDVNGEYGLPRNQGWVAAFRSGVVIKKSPYIQNCTSFNDSSIDNSIKYDQTNLPAGGLGGDQTSACTGGGILCDGSVPAANSPLRSFVVDSFTQINLDGPGILVTNSGYAQLVSFFGTFCHYQAKALNGGQINLSNCTTDFGRYGLIADGRSNAKITGQSVGTTAINATSIVVDNLALQNNFFSNQPGSTMVMEVGGESYQVLSASAVSSNTSTVNIYRATDADPNTNLGFKAQINDNTAVTFKLRSYISTGGHTFEYVGSGTDYTAHPDYGGIAVEANQVIELGGDGTSDDQIYNRGKVWQSSTDENGKFKVGDKFQVDQRLGTITLDGFTVAAEIVTDTTPQLGGDLDLNNSDIIGTGNINITGTVTATSYNGDGSSLTGIITDLVGDSTPQLGGNLDLNSNNVTGTGNVNITGSVTATSFSGDGSGLTGVGGDVVDDTTPQLGGDLDIQGFDITTATTNGNIDLTANGTGLIRVTENNLSQVPIVTQHDIGTASNEIPLNQYLGTAAFQDSDNFSVGNLQVATAYTVATLPSSPSVGRVARVTDASSPSVGSTVTGGAAAAALCWYNGTNWTVIGV